MTYDRSYTPIPEPPLTHHAMIRVAAPLVRQGLQIDLQRSDREKRYVEFKTQSSLLPATRKSYSLTVGVNNHVRLTRTLVHESGHTATLCGIVENLDDALDTFEQVPQERQIRTVGSAVLTFSYSLEKADKQKHSQALPELQFASANVCGIDLRIDTSTGGSMPADVRVMLRGKPIRYLPETLANGEELPLLHPAARSTQSPSGQGPVKNLPDDLLAVLGPQWRPLRFQGDHWKGVLRTLGKGAMRTSRAEHFIEQAVAHIADLVTKPPSAYHVQLLSARWRAYTRRLQPLMLFLGILALMPLSYFFVSNNELALHPLALGLTPLLMVGVVVLTAREIPVMELPPRPGPLPADFWAIETTT